MKTFVPSPAVSHLHSVNAGKVVEQCRSQLLLEPASKDLKLSHSFWTI